MILSKIFQIYKSAFSGLSKSAWMLALVMLLNRTGAMVIPFMTIYTTVELGFSTIQAGIVLSTFGIGSVIGSVLGGWMTDKIGSFKVQSLSLFLSAPIFALIPQFQSVVGVSAIVLLLSIIAETFRPANSASITLYAKPENITRAFSLNRMAVNLGFSFGPALGGFLATISYAWLFYGNAIGTFITGIVFYAYFRYKKKNKIQPIVENVLIEESEETGKSPYKDKWFLIFSVLCIFYAIVFSQIISVLPLFYSEVAHMSQKEVGLILGYSGLFIVVSEMIIVYYAERFLNIYSSIIIGTILGGATFFVLLFSSHIFALYLSMTLLCISEILVLPFIATIAAQRSSSKYKGAYMGVNSLSFSIAFIITPFLSSNIIVHLSYNALWIFNCILTIITVTGFLIIRRKMKR